MLQFALSEWSFLRRTPSPPVLCMCRCPHHLVAVGWPESASTPEARSALVKDLHQLKTSLFNEAIEGGEIPLRTGVLRLVDEAVSKGIPLVSRRHQGVETRLAYLAVASEPIITAVCIQMCVTFRSQLSLVCTE